MATDWIGAINQARLRGVDLTAEMTEADWAEYRQQSRSWLDGTPEGQAHKQRAMERIAAKQAIIEQAS